MIGTGYNKRETSYQVEVPDFVANSLSNNINANTSSLITATLTGSVPPGCGTPNGFQIGTPCTSYPKVNLFAKGKGASTNYPFSATSVTGNTQFFTPGQPLSPSRRLPVRSLAADRR